MKGIVKKRLRLMDNTCVQTQFSLKEVELLLSQILHDLISPFSALSAGIDLLIEPVSGHGLEDLTNMLYRSKQQLYDCLSLFRALFSYGYQETEGQRLLESYLNELGLTYALGTIRITKWIFAVCFWATKQLSAKTGHLSLTETQESLSIVLTGVQLRQSISHDAVIMGQKAPNSPMDIYSFFTKVLLDTADKRLDLQRTTESLTLQIKTLPKPLG